MKGKDLMEGMSFLEEELIEEAEGEPHVRSRWTKVMATAACLLLVAGVAVMRFSPESIMEGTAEGQLYCAAATEADTVGAPRPADGALEAKTLVVRLEKLREDGFTASFVESDEPISLTPGAVLNIRILEEAPETESAVREDIAQDDSRKENPEGRLFRVTVDHWDGEILYVTQVNPVSESEGGN